MDWIGSKLWTSTLDWIESAKTDPCPTLRSLMGQAVPAGLYPSLLVSGLFVPLTIRTIDRSCY